MTIYSTGKQASIHRLKLLAEPFRFDWQSRWNLSGTVEHWGHIHQRVNQYDADFTVAERDGHWKITQLKMTNNEGTVKTSLRKLKK